MGFDSKVISYSHVSVHNTPKDCWVIINAKAYNVTNFLDDHPGGEEVLLAAAGKDASEEFENAGHGSAARLMLDEFYVGEVDPSTNPTPASAILSPPQPEYDRGKTLESINKIIYLLVPLGIMAIAIGFHFYD
ncbi:cytochrome b5, seed isoform-like isoform X2 [Olea europaea var. sylvestris]|uniref:cytochrome b5, seed isoform-like isoform X2 n=1 Tax=Olea europaea var. sylvestris TaxID=158386 RepID=UPI000C1D5EE7|nr:cytochrome b5, seed isoform-like isoform X2 [Olea europaea var. sylvestris]